MSKEGKILLSPEEAYTAKAEKNEIEKTKEVTGNIEKVGDQRDMNEYLEAKKIEDPSLKVEIVDGGVAMSSGEDAHYHMFYSEFDDLEAGYAFGATSNSEVIDIARQEAKKGNKDIPKLILGHDTESAPDIKGSDLDEVAAGRPTALVNTSFHSVVANKEMMAMIKRLADKEQEAGRRVGGSLDTKTGIATEGFALLAIQVAESHLGIEKISEGMERQLDKMIKQGITNVHDLTPASMDSLIATLVARKRWEEDRKTEFPVRQFFIRPEIMDQLMQRQKELERAGLFDPDRDWPMIGYKLLADGSLGSHTAMLEKPFLDKNTRGVEFDDLETINKVIKQAQEYGLERVAMHAIGDRAIDRALKTAEKWVRLAEEAKMDPTKFRIEHFMMSAGKLDQAKSLGVWANSEPNFAASDYFHYEKRLGKERIDLICPHADILQKGINMHFGSDGMPTSVLYGLWAATHHPNPKQRISMEEAMVAYSLMAAEYENKGERVGIREGAQANIMILNKETMNELVREASPEEIRQFGEDQSGKADDLEKGISKVIRQGRIVYDTSK